EDEKGRQRYATEIGRLPLRHDKLTLRPDFPSPDLTKLVDPCRALDSCP
ncbi:hypothetical protein AVEN_27454-1, partial [Araneus ventricosus]